MLTKCNLFVFSKTRFLLSYFVWTNDIFFVLFVNEMNAMWFLPTK